MPIWVAKCYSRDTSIGEFNAEVEAGTSTGAERLIQTKYGACTVVNLHEKNGYDRERETGDYNVEGKAALLMIVVAIWALIEFFPWFMMFAGGAAAAKISEMVTGQTVPEYMSVKKPTQEQDMKAIPTFFAALISGGLFFLIGTAWQNNESSSDQSFLPKVEQVRQS